MNIVDYCDQILFSGDLTSKLSFPASIEFNHYQGAKLSISAPKRNEKIKFSDQQVKFPKKSALKMDEKKAIAFNAFANHELLAIEIMAYTLKCIPHENEEDILFKKKVLGTIKDEQKHFKLYQARLNELGFEFGDFPLNDFFWRYSKDIATKDNYLAIMALTFESANLDFAVYYRDLFFELQDERSAQIMDIVYQDEISHVALGGHYLSKWKDDLSLWDYYAKLLPWPITPARSKGMKFNYEGRRKANLPEDFILKLDDYRDNFKVTDRREWKS